MEPTAMSAFLSDVTTIVTQIIAWVTSVITLILGQPFLLFTVGFLALGKFAAEIKTGKNGKNLDQAIPC